MDGKHYIHRSRQHTELLVKELELGVLWQEYGLVGDVVVSPVLLLLLLFSFLCSFVCMLAPAFEYED